MVFDLSHPTRHHSLTIIQLQFPIFHCTIIVARLGFSRYLHRYSLQALTPPKSLTFSQIWGLPEEEGWILRQTFHSWVGFLCLWRLSNCHRLSFYPGSSSLDSAVSALESLKVKLLVLQHFRRLSVRVIHMSARTESPSLLEVQTSFGLFLEILNRLARALGVFSVEKLFHWRVPERSNLQLFSRFFLPFQI